MTWRPTAVDATHGPRPPSRNCNSTSGVLGPRGTRHTTTRTPQDPGRGRGPHLNRTASHFGDYSAHHLRTSPTLERIPLSLSGGGVEGGGKEGAHVS